METKDMVRMTNQIAAFFKSYPREEACRDAAAHISSFWTPHMRKELFAYLEKGGVGIDPLIVEAAPQIRRVKEDVK